MYDNIIEWPRMLLEKVLWIYYTLSSVTEGCSKLPTFCFLCTRSLLLIISSTAGFRPRADQGTREEARFFIQTYLPRDCINIYRICQSGVFVLWADNVVRFTRLFSRFHLLEVYHYYFWFWMDSTLKIASIMHKVQVQFLLLFLINNKQCAGGRKSSDL